MTAFHTNNDVRMFYQEFRPSPDLAEFVRLIWIMESNEFSSHVARERIMPDGLVELVFHYGDPFRTIHSDGEDLTQPQSFAVSTMRNYIEIEPNGAVGFVAVRLHPWGARHLFRTQVKEFLDRTIDMEYLWEGEHREVEDRLNEEVDHRERVGIVERFLRVQLGRNYRGDDAIDRIVRYVRSTNGSLSIEELCRRTGYSRRQLERKFLAAVGASPKLFSRNARFLNLCHHLETHHDRTLTELTYECGYYDQAHFIKEFKEFSGLTPREFFSNRNLVLAD